MPPLPGPTLLLDTATLDCSVALARPAPAGSALEIATEVEAVGNRHSQRALPLVDALLRRHGLAPSDCGGFAFGAGPGSFTGLRIACGLVQGLALGAGRPVVGVGHLCALAAAAGDFAGTTVVAIDARMDQVYWAAYGPAGDGLRPVEIAAPALADRGALPALLARWRPARLVAPPALAGSGEATWPASAAVAAAMVRIAHSELAAGNGIPASMAAPLYVRDRVAMTVEERRDARRREGALQ